MAMTFSSILRGVNRPENDKLNVLTINNDEKLQWLLSRTDHNFFYVNNPQSPPWNTTVREKPDNCILLKPGDLSEQVNDVAFDLIVCQNRSRDYNILSKLATHLSCPLLGINNFLPFPEMNQFYIQSLADQVYNSQIFSSKFVCNSWGLDDKDVAIIEKCVDTEIFSGWVRGDNKVLINCDWYQNRKNINGFDLLEKIGKQLPINLIGQNPGISSLPKNLDDLVGKYRNASVFLNTSSWLSCPLELLEALSTGTPCVSTKNCDTMDYITHGKNGFLSNDPEEIIKYSKELINNKELAKKIGGAGRKMMVEKFNEKIFVEKYNKIFYETIDRPCSLLIG